MWKIALCLLLLLGCSLLNAQAIVGTPTIFTTSGNQSYTVISTSDLVFVLEMNGAGDSYPTPPSAAGWTFNPLFVTNITDGGNLNGTAWVAVPPTTGAATISCTDHFGDPQHGIIYEVSGMALTTPQDGNGVGNNGTTANPASTGVTTTVTDAVFGMLIGPASTGTAGGYTAITTAGGNCSTAAACFEYKFSVAAGTPAPSFTAAAATWLVGAFAIKQTAAPTVARHRAMVKQN